MPNQVILQLLQDLRGGGFNTSLLLDGLQIKDQKVVAFANGVVFTVDQNGLARATVIAELDSVDF